MSRDDDRARDKKARIERIRTRLDRTDARDMAVLERNSDD